MAQPILLATGAQVRSLTVRSRLWELSELDGAAHLAGHWRSSPQPVAQIAPLWESSELVGAAYLAGHWRSSPPPVAQIAPLEFTGGAPGSNPQTPKQSLTTCAVAKMTAVEQTLSNKKHKFQSS